MTAQTVAMPLTDAHGVGISSSDPEAVAAYDTAVDHLVHFRAAVVDATDDALLHDPDLAMAHVLRAYLGVWATEAEDARTAREAFNRWRAGLDESRLQPTEQRHVAAAQLWLDGDLHGCAASLRTLTMHEPRDLVALVLGHQLDFFTGDAETLRDRIGAALPAWTTSDAHYAQVLGMYSFGLEEAGHYDRSEEVGRAAVEYDGLDVWGIHAVVHTYEMQGRFGTGIDFLDSRTAEWGAGNFLNVHNWWHRCLYALETGDHDRILRVYDEVLHNADSAGVAMEMLDAAALLWRLYLQGEDQTTRWEPLADAWAPKVHEPYYAFNDMHAVMSFVGAGRMADAERLVDDRATWLGGPQPQGVTNVAMTQRVGLPVCRSILAFGQGRYDEVVDTLMPIRYGLSFFGGSHAQRDAVQRTLLEAALRAGRLDEAGMLVNERISLKPCSPYNWLKHADLSELLGRAECAAADRGLAVDLAAAGDDEQRTALVSVRG
jgi:hypothetical protein